MKLEPGSEAEKQFVYSMAHEFALAEKAFDEFFMLAGANLQGISDYPTLERLYDAYARFVVHLYEFYVACLKRERGSTDNISASTMDAVLTAEVEKLMRNMATLIENGRAPEWANEIGYYKESVPSDFGAQFRNVRNNAAHVDPRRSGGGNRLTLREFLDRYHKFLFFLYDSARFAWTAKRDSPYILNHVSEFNLANRNGS